MKKKVLTILLLSVVLFGAFSFQIESRSIEEWNKFQNIYKEYLGLIIKSNSIEEMDKLEELYNAKIRAVSQNDIYLKFYQDKYISENIINIVSACITNISLHGGYYLCNIEVGFIANTDIIQPAYAYSSDSINAVIDNKTYQYNSMVIYDKNWNLIHSNSIVIYPGDVYKGQTGLIVYGMGLLDQKAISNGEIISIR